MFQVYKVIICPNILEFRQFKVKKPRHSESILVKMGHLYRRTRCTDSCLVGTGERIANAVFFKLYAHIYTGDTITHPPPQIGRIIKANHDWGGGVFYDFYY